MIDARVPAGADHSAANKTSNNYLEVPVRLRLALVAGAALLAGAAGVASASTATAPPPLPISITHDDRGICVTISLQTTHCVPLDAVGPITTADQRLPVGLPYRNGDEICWDPTPTSKGPCIPLN